MKIPTLYFEASIHATLIILILHSSLIAALPLPNRESSLSTTEMHASLEKRDLTRTPLHESLSLTPSMERRSSAYEKRFTGSSTEDYISSQSVNYSGTESVGSYSEMMRKRYASPRELQEVDVSNMHLIHPDTNSQDAESQGGEDGDKEGESNAEKNNLSQDGAAVFKEEVMSHAGELQ